jgi:lysyl-tRNA synthetase class 2
MADAAPSAAPEEQLANLHLDEVTGEKVSKSELKKRQKQRQADEKDLNPNGCITHVPVLLKRTALMAG